MPIYEYECKRCGGKFEVFQSRADEDAPPCKFCNGPVKKLISLSSFHLKGSGWYVTDYARKGTHPKGEGKKGSSTDSGSGTEKSGEGSSAKKGDDT